MENEAQLAAKFGGLKPKPRLIMKEKKCFDSADWALAKEGGKKQDAIPAASMAVPELPHHAKHTSSGLKPSG